jgi:hypothetical protein
VVILVVVELLEEVVRNGWEVLLILNELFEGLRYANFHLVEIHVDSVVLVQAITPRPNGGGSLQGDLLLRRFVVCLIWSGKW